MQTGPQAIPPHRVRASPVLKICHLQSLTRQSGRKHNVDGGCNVQSGSARVAQDSRPKGLPAHTSCTTTMRLACGKHAVCSLEHARRESAENRGSGPYANAVPAVVQPLARHISEAYLFSRTGNMATPNAAVLTCGKFARSLAWIGPRRGSCPAITHVSIGADNVRLVACAGG